MATHPSASPCRSRTDLPAPADPFGVHALACVGGGGNRIITNRLITNLLLLALLLPACSRSLDTPPDPNSAQHAWPQFRGPTGQGTVSPGDSYPTDWDPATGRNILWKIELPVRGHSSPIVWQDRLFLTGDADEKGHLLCLNTADGSTRWSTPVVTASPELTGQSMGAGLCAPTPATDGQRVYALFATGDVACLDLAGKIVWQRHLCNPVNSFSLASSPILWNDLLIVQLDQGNSPSDNLSRILALDTKTGQPKWSTQRPVPNGWSTPVVITHEGRPQLLTAGSPWVISYDPASGAELWRFQALAGEVVPMPVYTQGRVLVANEHAKLVAINPGGSGDVTATHALWSLEEDDNPLPGIASPLTDGQRLLLCAADAWTCFDVKTGRRLWQQKMEDGVAASPTLVGQRVYQPTERGQTVIFELADEYKTLAIPDLQEEISASPAFSRGRIYLRTKRHLYCLGQR